MNYLKRELAPILPEAWEAIEEEARLNLRQELVGRRVVDFVGPVGWERSALNLGSIKVLPEQDGYIALRDVQPFVELRVPFRLGTLALDTLSRGNAHPDFDPVAQAARRAASIENQAVFGGVADGAWKGLRTCSPHEPIPMEREARAIPAAVVKGLTRLRDAGVGGPYALVVGSAVHDEILAATDEGYPVIRHIEKELIDGRLVRADGLQGALIVSMRGGDFELTVGQDFAIGYAHRTDHEVELYIAESFAFRVIEPRACVNIVRH